LLWEGFSQKGTQHLKQVKFNINIDKWEAYMKQARQECGIRLILKVFPEENQPSKYWMQFSKRKFLKKELKKIQ
jgi:hypothetical protein